MKEAEGEMESEEVVAGWTCELESRGEVQRG